MISSHRYFNPAVGNVVKVAYGYLTVDSQNQPLFILPANSIIKTITVYGPPFTKDGIATEITLGQAVLLGTADHPDKFMALDNAEFGYNPINISYSSAYVLSLVFGSTVKIDDFTLREETLITGTYVKGTSDANGGGPLVVIFDYLEL